MLLPASLTDLLFAGEARDAEVCLAEENPAMREVLGRYGEEIFRQAGASGTFRVTGDRREALRGADCVLYAGDCEAATRFAMDRSALSGEEEDDPGLTDQARVSGGIGGLLHTLRAGSAVLDLCDEMDEACPEALVVHLSQPTARITEIFALRGYRCFGLGPSPWKGPNGLEALTRRLGVKPEEVSARIAGLPGFAFLLGLKAGGKDLLPRVKRMVKDGEWGNLARRWLSWWDAVPVGDVTRHAEFLPAQPDYIPEERPAFGESVEKRRERILWMNTVAEQGAASREGAMAQLLLLSKASPLRPVRLALALLRGETAVLPAVSRRNRGELSGLPPEAVIEADLHLREGEILPEGQPMPPALTEIMREIDETNRLAARAAFGDRGALRECLETDPALAGLDRLYCQDLTEKLMELHSDVLPRFSD